MEKIHLFSLRRLGSISEYRAPYVWYRSRTQFLLLHRDAERSHTLLEIDVRKVYENCSLRRMSPPVGMIKVQYHIPVAALCARWSIVYAAILNVKQRVFVVVYIRDGSPPNLIASVSLDWSTEAVVTFDTGIVSRPF